MYIDLTLHKSYMLAGIVVLLVLALGAFLVANGAWHVVPQTEYFISRTVAGVEYRLRYAGLAESIQETPSATSTAISIPVLLYHGESGGPDMPQSVFIDQMRALKAAGWQTITMKQFEAWERGEIQLPAKSFLLTFDDGRTDTFYPVDPVLQDLGYNAVMFVITGFSLPPSSESSGFYLNRTELSNMIASGRWELESHGDEDHRLYRVQSTTDLSQQATTTEGHFLSNKFWNPSANRFETDAEFQARVTNDLEAAKQKLQDTFGIQVDAFAYPFNDFGQDSVNFPGSRAILAQAVPDVYSFAFYQWGVGDGDTFNYPETTWAVKRIEPSNSWSGADLLSALQAGEAKQLPYRAASFGDASGWSGTWGSVSVQSAGLSLSSSAQTSGASALLNGSGWWSDYEVDAQVNWVSGDSVSLLARINGKDAAVCAFTKQQVALKRSFDGGMQTIAQRSYAFAGNPASTTIAMQVAGDKATCVESGVPVVSGSSAQFDPQGGIGVEVWDRTLGSARGIVKSVSAHAISSVSIPSAS